MKRLMFLLLLFLPLAGHSQGFFKPVSKDILPTGTDRSAASVWLIRPVITITAMEIVFGEETVVQPLSSMGTGVSYAHFIDHNGEPYQNFSANLMVLFGTEVAVGAVVGSVEGEPSPMELSVAGTVSLWQYLSLGVGYNFMDKKAFLLTGVAINFNK